MLIGALVVVIWVYLVFARGMFWRLRESSPVLRPTANLRVVIIIPARNEAQTIRACIASCVEQDYAAQFQIVLVDDHSSDSTAELARMESDRITIVKAEPVPEGWTGKLWAVQCGIKQAEAFHPDYVLLTDADIVHAPQMLSGLVGRAERDGLDLASYMVMLRCASLAEKALIPAFVYFFFELYPPGWIEDPSATTAGAAGGCILIRRAALERIGGIASIRGSLIDDCALALRVKQSGGRIWLGTTPESASIRAYDTFPEIRRMISRTAFTQLNYSALLLAGTIFGLFVTYLLPPILLLFASGMARVLGGIAWALMAFTYLPMLRFYRRSPLWAFTLPLIATFYAAATMESALNHWRGSGGEWKGRFQS